MIRPRTPTPLARQRGVALLLVLWACTLLAILLGGYAALAHTEAVQARYQFAQSRAHYAAEAGVMRAIYGLQDPQPKRRWMGDGRVYPFQYDGATVKVSAIDEGGKVDLNAASPKVLEGLFRAAGLAPDAAATVADNVAQWRSFASTEEMVDSQRALYEAAGRDYGPRHGPLASVEELQMVLGVTPALYRTVAPAVTLWSGRSSPNPATAPALALAAIPGMDEQHRNAIQTARQQGAQDPNLVVRNGVTHSIRSEATLADGTRAVLRVTVRLQGGQAAIQPYKVLRWQEGDGE